MSKIISFYLTCEITFFYWEIIVFHCYQFPGIVYCFTQKESEEVTRELRQQGIKTGCYHASIPAKQKSQIHEMWLADKILVS